MNNWSDIEKKKALLYEKWTKRFKNIEDNVIEFKDEKNCQKMVKLLRELDCEVYDNPYIPERNENGRIKKRSD